MEGKRYAGTIDKSGQGIKWYNYTGVIENISEGGLCLRTSPVQTTIDFSPGETLKLEFQILTGEAFNLQCMVKWSKETQRRIGMNDILLPNALKYVSTGMEIVSPPSKFRKFIKSRLKQHN